MKSRIVFLENKSEGDGLTGPSKICRVTFSKSGKTLHYKGAELQSLKGGGYKANYYDINTGEYYWVSGPKKNGQDTLYPDSIEIDEDVREEYWREIRCLPECVTVEKIRSEGKHAGWRAAQFAKKTKT